MKTIKNILYSAVIMLLFINASCTKPELGIPTAIKGKVVDEFRVIGIENYKIVLIKSWGGYSGLYPIIKSEEVATVYTDKNGNYEIKFDYKLNKGESYGFMKVYSNAPYEFEYKTNNTILAGQENIIDINAWKPIILKINLTLKNNTAPPFVVGIAYKTDYTFGTIQIYEKEIFKTFEIYAKPNSDVTIDFWYYENYIAGSGKHFKSIPYKTDLSEITELNYEIDCSSF